MKINVLYMYDSILLIYVDLWFEILVYKYVMRNMKILLLQSDDNL